MSTQATPENAYTTEELARKDGFRADAEIEQVDLKTFLARESEHFTEYIHVYPDNAEGVIRLYRSVEDEGNKRIMTVIEDAHFKMHRYDDRSSDELPRNFFLSSGEADTLLTALTAYKWDASRSPARVTLAYTPNAKRPMMDKYGVVEETLRFTYTTDSGKSNTTAITSLYENHIQSIASY